MSIANFVLALSLLLAVPGPTNMVLAVAGAQRGFWRGLPMLLAVLGGYLVTISTLLVAAAPFLHAHPMLARLVTVTCALWVLFLALRLWQARGVSGEEGEISAVSLFATTLLNPKGLVIGLTLLPVDPPAGLAVHGAALVGTVLAVSALWLGVGATVVRAIGLRYPALVARGAAGSLILFAAGLAGRAAGWV